MTRIKKIKKNQQETVGFVIIILLVLIVGVIFLGIWLRASKSGGVFTESAELSNFISASMSYTTECYKDTESDRKSVGDLISYCDSKQEISCPNGAGVCDYLNNTYTEMLKTFKPAGVLSYSKLSVYFKETAESDSSEENTGAGAQRQILTINSGSLADCAVKRAGRGAINAGEGDYIVELETCDKG